MQQRIKRALKTLPFLFLLPFSSLDAQDGGLRRTWILQPPFSTIERSVPGILPVHEVKRPRVALVLSGGGARGMAAIGVIEAFERNKMPIDFIVGTSIGSIVGGLYAAGYSTEQLKALIDTTDWEDLLSFSDESHRRDLFYDQKLAEDRSILILRFDGLEPVIPESFSTGQRLTNYLNILALQATYHPLPTFDQLKIPFRAATTDLISGKRIIIGRGDLHEAMRASVTVPLLFSPVKRDTTLLLDGGLISNIPADVAHEWGADIIVVVDVTSPLRPASNLNAPWEIADQIIGITMQLANREQLKYADYVIRPDIGSHLSSDFTKLDSLIIRGEEAADLILPFIRQEYEVLLEKSSGDTTRIRFPRFVFDPVQLPEQWSARLTDLAVKRSLGVRDARSFLRDLYATGDFERVEFAVEEFSDHTVLRLQATPTPVLQSVEFVGNRLVSTDTLQAIMAPLVGDRINTMASRNAIEKILKMYRSLGYSIARIPSVELDRSSGKATIRIDEGTVYRRTIVGTKKTKDYVLWRELPWRQGEVFEVSKVAEGITNLYSTNLFEQVAISVREEGESGQHQVVEIRARERYTDLIRLGSIIDNERNAQVSVDVRDENFLGIGSELGVRFFGGLRNRDYTAEFKANRIFNSYLTFNLKGYYSLRDINVFKNEPAKSPTRWNRVRDGEYREVREGVSATFGTQLERLGLVTIEGRLENQRLWSIFNMPILPESYHLVALRLGTKVDTQDRFPFSREGDVMNFYYETALVGGENKIGYTKMVFGYEWSRTFWVRQTIRPKIVFGFGDENVQRTESFALGGQHSFFGVREDNARGRQLFLASLEYRYFLPIKILFDAYAKIRYDLGNIWENREQIRLKDLRHGIGVTLALDTPIGPAEISVGRSFFIRKDLFDNPLSYGPITAYFTIGYAF